MEEKSTFQAEGPAGGSLCVLAEGLVWNVAGSLGDTCVWS